MNVAQVKLDIEGSSSKEGLSFKVSHLWETPFCCNTGLVAIDIGAVRSLPSEELLNE